MPRGRRLFWTAIGIIVAASAVAIALIEVNPGSPPKAAPSPVVASSPALPIATSASPQAAKSARVVTPSSGSSPFTYVSALTPASKANELLYPGSVELAGSIYPKSISFYCYDGDPPAFPVYSLKHNDRRFEATVGMEAKWPSSYLAGVKVLGDGHTLRVFSVSVLKPKTIDVNVTGVHLLKLECFSPGITSAASAADVEVAWGNARVTEGH